MKLTWMTKWWLMTMNIPAGLLLDSIICFEFHFPQLPYNHNNTFTIQLKILLFHSERNSVWAIQFFLDAIDRGGLSFTALYRPMRWINSLSKLSTAQLRPHPYWASMVDRVLRCDVMKHSQLTSIIDCKFLLILQLIDPTLLYCISASRFNKPQKKMSLKQVINLCEYFDTIFASTFPGHLWSKERYFEDNNF